MRQPFIGIGIYGIKSIYIFYTGTDTMIPAAESMVIKSIYTYIGMFMCTKSTIPHADRGRVPQGFRRVLIDIYGFKRQSDRCGYLFGKKIASQTVRSDFFTATTDAPLYKYDTFGIFIIVSDRLQGFYIGLRQIPVILFLTIELIVVICRKKAFMSFR